VVLTQQRQLGDDESAQLLRATRGSEAALAELEFPHHWHSIDPAHTGALSSRETLYPPCSYGGSVNTLSACSPGDSGSALARPRCYRCAGRPHPLLLLPLLLPLLQNRQQRRRRRRQRTLLLWRPRLPHYSSQTQCPKEEGAQLPLRGRGELLLRRWQRRRHRSLRPVAPAPLLLPQPRQTQRQAQSESLQHTQQAYVSSTTRHQGGRCGDHGAVRGSSSASPRARKRTHP
jgi:hypothetical protein